jgi:hypothetical protein
MLLFLVYYFSLIPPSFGFVMYTRGGGDMASVIVWQQHLAQPFHHHPVKDTASYGATLLSIGGNGVSDQRISVVAVA